jgi:alpha-methylacyl-CoA racemase
VPKFSRTAPGAPTAPVEPRSDTGAVLTELGVPAERIEQLRADGVIA